MKPASRLLARLYPARWRARYGEEFDALIEDAGSDAHSGADLLKGAIKMQFTHWGSARIVMLSALTGALIATAIAISLPYRYVSTAVVRVSGQDSGVISQTLVRILSRPALATQIRNLHL